VPSSCRLIDSPSLEGVRLTGIDTVIEIEPVSYQFADPKPLDRGDRNWLVIAGWVQTADGAWAFRDSCLMTWEAEQIHRWWRAVAGGVSESVQPDGGTSPNLTFIEPNLAFSLAHRDEETAEIRVHFSLESAPPWLDHEEQFDIWKFYVVLPFALCELAALADVWEQELEPFPER
jgi:hypothetical protein